MSPPRVLSPIGELIASDGLPIIRGKYRPGADLSKMCWFGSGGKAELMFIPYDIEDLVSFLQNITVLANGKFPITILGIGSNLLIRDGGVDGVVIRLGRGFSSIAVDAGRGIVRAGASSLDVNVAKESMEYGMGGIEFFSGIPGTIGGALAMNAGAYGCDTASVLKNATAVAYAGSIRVFKPNEMDYRYRGNGLSDEWIFVSAEFNVTPEDKNVIQQKILDIQIKRESSQPIRSRTSGSTFRNPDGYKAWQLIDEAGCRGMRIGGAHVSEMHCNFFINDQNASSDDIEKLISMVKLMVFERSGVVLEEEVKIIGVVGKFKDPYGIDSSFNNAS